MNKEKIKLILKLVKDSKITDSEAILLMEDGIEYYPVVVPNWNKENKIQTLPYIIPEGPGDTPDSWKNSKVTCTNSIIYKDGKIYSPDEIDNNSDNPYEKIFGINYAKDN